MCMCLCVHIICVYIHIYNHIYRYIDIYMSASVPAVFLQGSRFPRETSGQRPVSLDKASPQSLHVLFKKPPQMRASFMNQ